MPCQCDSFLFIQSSDVETRPLVTNSALITSALHSCHQLPVQFCLLLAAVMVFWVWRLTVCYMDTNVLVKSDASIIRVVVKSLPLPCRKRHYIPPKGFKLHDVTPNKTVVWCHITSRRIVNISCNFTLGSATEHWKWIGGVGGGVGG